ncbi:MAG: hypothetical protein ACR2OL_09180 [Anderseniella sp.]
MRIFSYLACVTVLAATGTLSAGVSAETRGYYVAPTPNGEFRSMRCTINGQPVGSKRSCRQAANLARAGAGWAQAKGPGVKAYYEIGVPTPQHGGRHMHNSPVLHQHRGSHGVYSHYGYLGNHEVYPNTGKRLRQVHTGSSKVEIISGEID